jgi:succinyl-CoA synthetase beta subunit
VQRLLIEETAAIDRELYLGIVLDRATGKLVFMASQAGGMEIEEVAAKTPKPSSRNHRSGHRLRRMAGAQAGLCAGLKPTQINQAVVFLQSLYKAFIDTDASLLEINPFITTKDDKLFALDAKITFDDNALFRHPGHQGAARHVAEEDPLEVEASKYALNYIKLDGSIACMVNGAGLAMATMDIIQYAGGSPANFLDVGGGATQEQIEHAFEILLSDANVKAIFINIFGGILRVDRLATGVVAAARNLNVKVPIVLRLEGTNVEEGRRF